MNIKTLYGHLLSALSKVAGVDAAKIFDTLLRDHKLLNLKNPESLAEKVSYIELHAQSPLAPSCTDKYAVRQYRLPGQKIPVIFNGVNLSKCQIKHDYATKEAFTIIHIGRFMDVKNHSLLLHSFSRFAEHHPEARIQLIGEGELQHNMEQLAVEIGIAQKVYFAGLQSDIFPWLHQADVFILTSKYEGMPMTLIEAMGTGLPVIATKVGGIPDIITDGEEGILTEPDSEQIAVAMERMIDVEFRQKCGEKARKKAVAQFAAETMAEKYVKLYQRLLNIKD